MLILVVSLYVSFDVNHSQDVQSFAESFGFEGIFTFYSFVSGFLCLPIVVLYFHDAG